MSTTPTIDISQVLAELTLEEKASLLSGKDFWYTKGIDRLGVRSVMVTDGPHGLRKQDASADHLGLGHSVPATCFPTAAALGSTWDTELLHRVGAALGAETAANDVAVILGPGVNIKRSPLCGRNFEYFSEDPVLSGESGAALVNGIQSRGVGTSLKHFAANNQESDRMRVSAEVDQRTLREIYLASFERAVTKANPVTVMCSYNKINGVYTHQDRWLLTEVLRGQWGYDGLVVSDWGAVRDRVPALTAGLDLQMPADGGRSDAEIVAAVRSGELDESVVDEAVRRLLGVLNRTAAPKDREYDAAAHHALAREAAAAGCVLLRNEPVAAPGNGRAGTPLLPLAPDADIAVIGEFARTPRYQGAGSSQVNPTRLDGALDTLRAERGDVPFAAGFTIEGGPDGDDETLAAEAVDLARGAGTVLLFLGLPAPRESEGFDRTDLDLPANQLALLERVVAVNPQVVVVLANGGVVTLPFHESVPAIVEGWLGGQGGGSGVVDVLTGAVNPSGRLAETIPVRLEHTAAYGNFPGEFSRVRYGEGNLVGYRWYDARQLPVAYPFGHGLSYTTFAYSGVTATLRPEGAGTPGGLADDDARPGNTGPGADVGVDVSVTVTNTGDRAGAEVVQVYVGDPVSAVQRPERELKAFAKVWLEPGASRKVTFHLDARDLSYWHPVLERWVVEGGEFVIAVGASSRDLRGEARIDVIGEQITLPLHEMSTLGEAMAHPVAGPMLRQAMAAGGEGGLLADPGMAALIGDMPLKAVADMGMSELDADALAQLVAAANAG